MSLRNKVENSPPNEGQKQVIKEQARMLGNQLEHLLDVREFMIIYQNLDIQPDELHRELFQRTSLTPRGFKMRMTKASRASEVIGSMLQTSEYYSEITADLKDGDFSHVESREFYNTFNQHDYDYNSRFQEAIKESIEVIRTEDITQNLTGFYTDIDSETFETVSTQFDKMADWYKSILLEEDLISEGESRTPSFPVLVALCIVYLTAMLMIAIGYHEEDAFKILTGINALAMGVLAFAGL